VANFPCGSRISTQRSGTGGWPGWYQTAVAEAICTARAPLPYHWATVSGTQTSVWSSAIVAKAGSR
jgi:hypothetical protein